MNPRADRRARTLLAGLVSSALLALPAVGFAAGGGSGEHSEEALRVLGFALLNFVILIVVLRRYAWEPIKFFLLQRSENVRSALEASQTKLAEAQAEIARLNERIAKLGQESDALIASSREQAEFERERMEQRATQTAERIRTDTQRVVDVEIQRARQALREEAVALAESLARDLLREQLTTADDDRLIREFTQRVEGRTH